jgi:hypothetical protein
MNCMGLRGPEDRPMLLHSFGGLDGRFPTAGVILSKKGTLYTCPHEHRSGRSNGRYATSIKRSLVSSESGGDER